MTSFPWLAEVNRNAPMPDGLKLHDQQAYQALASLCRRYAKGLISKSDATREKHLILAAWEKAKESDTFADALCSHWIAVIRATEASKAEVRLALKNGDSERIMAAAGALVKALEGVTQNEAVKSLGHA